MAIHEFTLNGLKLRTGDLICTVDGDPSAGKGWFWRLVGWLLPGKVDHVVVYVGPGGRCIEAGAKLQVIAFDVPGPRWDAQVMEPDRNILDEMYGVAYPTARRGLSLEREIDVRQAVAAYCEAAVGKPYNIIFPAPQTEKAFYCSQLAYKAYQPHGIDLSVHGPDEDLPMDWAVVYPQHVWDSCRHKRARR